MKCRSVACIWSSSPPAHKVTATAVLNHPPTLYTGGSDGSIIWWNLSVSSSTQPNQGVEPIAMLCGHTAAIADLGICFPSAVSSNIGALISVCNDGVLCVWSRSSGHCRRRRKMPPWVGSPSMVQSLPENERYVCIGCWYADGAHLSDYQSVDVEKEGLVDRESHHEKFSKCTVVIVDSYSLTIVQTVFHGNLSIGPLKSMSVILSAGHLENHLVMMVDSFSKVQCLPILKDSDANGSNPTVATHLALTDWVDGSEEGGLLVACANRGQLLAFVYTTHCTFRLVDNGNKIGEIHFLDHLVCLKGLSHVIGGMLIGDDDSGIRQNFAEYEDIISEKLAVWNSRGSAAVYRISYSSNTFNFEPLLAIPAVSHPPDVKLSISFLSVDHCLLRVESICFHDEEPLFWKPHVTVWLLQQQEHSREKFSGECKRFSEGQYFDDWIPKPTYKTEYSLNEISSSTIGLEGEAKSLYNTSCSYNSEKFVSSSMVISENYYPPFALVYGFCDGDIEVVWLDMCFEGLGSYSRNQCNEASSHGSKRYLSGHTGAVLCLAAHQMVSVRRKGNFSHVLVSGSMDCTVRIWDLDSSSPIIVMHQHIAPVRQIILPPPHTGCPWSDCFLSVAEDCCVALTSLGTLQVERMFPGQPYYPAKVVWDSARGYVACLCPNHLGISETSDVLYIWDVKTGARERVLRGAAAHSMMDHFCLGMKKDSNPASLMTRNTSASSLILPLTEENKYSHSHLNHLAKGAPISSMFPVSTSVSDSNRSQSRATKATVIESIESTISAFRSNKAPIEGSCPFPGITTLCFDLKSMMSLCKSHDFSMTGSLDHRKNPSDVIGADTPNDSPREKNDSQQKHQETDIANPHDVTKEINSDFTRILDGTISDYDSLRSLERCLLQFSMSLLHLWNVDYELDKLLETEMKLKRPEIFNVASGLVGDRGSLTLTFPGSSATLQLWRSSSEYCALRSLTMVALAQHMVSLSPSCSGASSALAAFYARNFAEKIPDVKPPLLQLLVSFWQDEFEHVKMAALSLFHCAASRAVPRPLCCKNVNFQENSLDSSIGTAKLEPEKPNSLTPNCQPETQRDSQTEDSEILSWLESFDTQDWISCVGGTTQDAMNSHIIVSAALAVWYPSLVKPSLAMLTVQSLMKLVMAMNEKYSLTAAEILAEGMESTWKACIGSEIPRLIADIFFQIECVSGASTDAPAQNSAVSHSIKETLVGVLLPSLAMADILGFLNVIQSQVWSTASDSPVHVVSLMILIRVVRGSPRNLAQYLDKVVTFILQTMDSLTSFLLLISQSSQRIHFSHCTISAAMHSNSFRTAAAAVEVQQVPGLSAKEMDGIAEETFRRYTTSSSLPERKGKGVAIVWFRNDLRILDNEALFKAWVSSQAVLPVYCVDPRLFSATHYFGFPKTGALRAQFLMESLVDLKRNLKSRGLDLLIKQGKPEDILPSLAKAYRAPTVYAQKETCSEELNIEKLVTRNLQYVDLLSSEVIHTSTDSRTGTKLELIWGGSLYHIDDIPFNCECLPGVYTQFRKSVESKSAVRACVKIPPTLGPPPSVTDWGSVPEITQLGLQMPKVSRGMRFMGGETAALSRVHEYFWKKDLLRIYKETRNGMLGPDYSTKFSPWLASGNLSARFIYEEVKRYETERLSNNSTYWVLFELIWRDYFRFLSIKHRNSLFHPGGPRKVEVNWSQDHTLFEAWRDGHTGYPLIDANMRELSTTGFMSNRGRQIVCSFLVRDMGIDWRMGAEWFESCLLDYDPCSNYGNWTYGAGVGNDPREDRYFSIPKQAQSYDPEGEFVAFWLPELRALPKDKRNFPGLSYIEPVVALKFGGNNQTSRRTTTFVTRSTGAGNKGKRRGDKSTR